MLGGLLCELPATGSVLRSWRDQHLLVGGINPNHLGQSKKTLTLQADGVDPCACPYASVFV